MKADFCFWAKPKFYRLKGETFYILHLWLGYQRGSMLSEIHLSPQPTGDIYRKFCRRAYRRKSERHCQERFLDLAWKQKMKVMGLMTGTAVKLLEWQSEFFVRDSISYILYVRLSVWSSAASKNYAGKRAHVLPSSLYGNVQHTKLRQCLHTLPWNSLPSCIPSASSPAFFLRLLDFHFESDCYSFWSLLICSTLALFCPPPPLSLSLSLSLFSQLK